MAYVGPYPELKEVNYKKEDWFQSVMSGGIYISDVFLGFRRFPHFIIAVMSREGTADLDPAGNHQFRHYR